MYSSNCSSDRISLEYVPQTIYVLSVPLLQSFVKTILVRSTGSTWFPCSMLVVSRKGNNDYTICVLDKKLLASSIGRWWSSRSSLLTSIARSSALSKPIIACRPKPRTCCFWIIIGSSLAKFWQHFGGAGDRQRRVEWWLGVRTCKVSGVNFLFCRCLFALSPRQMGFGLVPECGCVCGFCTFVFCLI